MHAQGSACTWLCAHPFLSDDSCVNRRICSIIQPIAAGSLAVWLLVMAVAWVLLHTVKRSSAQLQADVIGQNKVVLTFVTNHLPISEGEKLVKVLLDICQPTCCIKVRT